MSAQPQPNTWYRIKSTKGTVLDDWGGKTGENSAALQLDDIPDSLNRRWQLIPVEPGWWRIKSTKGTVLDDWGGKTGENSAALQPDDTPNSPNRKWSFVPTGDGWFRIKSTKGTVLDDWAGKTGENSAALQLDDAPNSPNRKWMLVPVTQVPTTTTPTAHPKLALLADLVGEWQGPGMNTIAVPSPTGTLGIFKLMVHSTVEHMSFEAVEQVFNRGSKFDIELNGVKYLQKVTDKTNGAEIHLEPGFWLHVPQSAQDQESYVRLATVPHGDSLLAVSTQFSSSMGPPQFNAVSTIPFPLNSAIPDLFAPNTINTANPYFDPFTKPSQLPPGLTAEMVQNPVLNLQQHVAGQQILDTITFRITTNKPGGITNIPFVVREANAVLMDAVFWIETVRGADGKTFKQLQYVQRVVLDFPPDHWPHISVGTLRKVGQLE